MTLLLLSLLGCSPPPSLAVLDQTWVPVEAPTALTGLNLEDHRGEAVDVSWFVGQFSIVALGYTGCPDVCPTTLSGVAHALRTLEADGLSVRAAFIGVDPERDRAALPLYVSHFHPGITGLTGTPDALQHVATQLGGAFSISFGDEGLQVDHSTSLFVVDPGGRVVGYALRGGDGAAIAADVTSLIRDYAPPISLQYAWIRPPIPGTPATAGYGNLVNHTDHSLHLDAVSSPVTRAITVHETIQEGGRASMRHASIDLLPGESANFEPGGLHLMMYGMAATSETVPLLFSFADGTEYWVHAPLRVQL